MFTRLFFVGALLCATTASAHFSISSGPAAADKSQKIVFGSGHGCEDASGNHYDTYKIRIDIPAGVTSVRALALVGFGKPTVTKTGAQVTSIEWVKATADILTGDDAYYEPSFRARIANTPFTRIGFTIHQTCDVMGTDQTTVWTGTTGDTTGPQLTVIPARTNATGWNKITLSAAVANADLGAYFGDAQILWRGTEAYSPNVNTKAQIEATAGVTWMAGDLAVGDVIWVRY